MKFKIKLFNGKNNFILQQSTIKDVLTAQGLGVIIEDPRPKQLKDVDLNPVQKNTVNQVLLAFVSKIKYNVLGKSTSRGIWEKLEYLCF